MIKPILKRKLGAQLHTPGGTRSAVFVIALTPKVFSADVHLLDRAPNQVAGKVHGALQGIVGLLVAIIYVHITEHGVGAQAVHPPVLESAVSLKGLYGFQVVAAIKNSVIETVVIVAANSRAIYGLKAKVVLFRQQRHVENARQLGSPTKDIIVVAAIVTIPRS